MRALLTAAFFLALAAPASAWIPNDPGIAGSTPGGWQSEQWNFLPGTGVDAPRAWDNLIAAGRPGGKGVKIAVLDSGVAYDRSPDLSSDPLRARSRLLPRGTGSGELACVGRGRHARRRVRPRDARREHDRRDDRTTRKGLTGLAYGATIIPVKVLNRYGDGDEDSIANGLRYAADHGAQIINLSFEFGSSTTSASEIPKIAAAVSTRAARAR